MHLTGQLTGNFRFLLFIQSSFRHKNRTLNVSIENLSPVLSIPGFFVIPNLNHLTIFAKQKKNHLVNLVDE